MKRRRRWILYIIFSIFVWWCWNQLVSSKSFKQISKMFLYFDPALDIQDIFNKTPILRDRLILIDDVVLSSLAEKEPCLFCHLSPEYPVTFALLCPLDVSLEEHILLPILKAWELGFWIEQIISSVPRKFAPFPAYHTNLPLGFILQRSRTSAVFEIVLLHEREGDFWWHGSLYEDEKYKKKLSNLKLSSMREEFKMKEQGAFEKFQYEQVLIDNIKMNIPKQVNEFIHESSQSKFMECNYERADRFYKTYGKDLSPLAVKFSHKTWKLLSIAKTILDTLKIPFWISSGTCLGYYRQCGIIPYSNDVDIGIFIKDYNNKLIPEFQARNLNLVHKFGRVNDSLELSFVQKKLKLDIFFFYEEEDHMWNGGHKINWKNGQIESGIKYKFTFPKFTLCWTEFLDLKVRIPCETEAYITANYGPNWFEPVSEWSWRNSPFNIKENGVWKPEDVGDALVIYKVS